MKSRFSLLFLLIGSISLSTLFGKVEIVSLPTESNITAITMDFIKQQNISKHLTKLFEDKQPIEYFTPAEAHQYLNTYVEKQYGSEEAIALTEKFFNDHYFGKRQVQTTQKTPIEIAEQDPYLFTHICNMLQFNRPGREETMEEAKKRWNTATLFLSPQEVFDAFANHNFYGSKIKEKNFSQYKQQFPEQAEAIFSEKYFGIPEDTEQRKNYFLSNSLGFFTQSLVKSIYDVAQKIMTATKQGDYIIIFGNTPYFIGRALQAMISKNPENKDYRTIIEFPFSGTPNGVRAHNFPDMRNIVTQERLDHLNQRLEHVGLSPKNKDLNKHAIYLIDVIGSGSGPAYMIEEVLRNFTACNTAIPNLNIISLNKIDIVDERSERNRAIAYKSADDGEHVTLHFPSKEKTHFTIDAQVIFIEEHTLLDMLPSNDWRIFPEYNAAYWQSDYEYLLEKPEGIFTKTLLEFFDTNLTHITDMAHQK